MPAEAEDTEQPSHHGRWLRNPSQLDIVDDGLQILSTRRASSESHAQGDIRLMINGRRNGEGENVEAAT